MRKISSTALVIGSAVLVVVVVLGIWIAGNIFSQKSANFRGETSKRNQVEANGQFRVGSYDRFFDECASVQNAEAQITEIEAELKVATSAESKAQLTTFLSAAKIGRATAINTYNVDVRKSYTIGQFRDPSLPYQIDASTKETVC